MDGWRCCVPLLIHICVKIQEKDQETAGINQLTMYNNIFLEQSTTSKTHNPPCNFHIKIWVKLGQQVKGNSWGRAQY